MPAKRVLALGHFRFTAGFGVSIGNRRRNPVTDHSVEGDIRNMQLATVVRSSHCHTKEKLTAARYKGLRSDSMLIIFIVPTASNDKAADITRCSCV
jgi:hypothetical protein